jgi:hypothetical protein
LPEGTRARLRRTERLLRLRAGQFEALCGEYTCCNIPLKGRIRHLDTQGPPLRALRTERPRVARLSPGGIKVTDSARQQNQLHHFLYFLYYRALGLSFTGLCDRYPYSIKRYFNRTAQSFSAKEDVNEAGIWGRSLLTGLNYQLFPGREPLVGRGWVGEKRRRDTEKERQRQRPKRGIVWLHLPGGVFHPPTLSVFVVKNRLQRKPA